MKDFLKLVLPFFYGSQKRYARLGGLWLLILSQASTAYGYLFIQWNRRFYDALEAKNAAGFYKESMIFMLIVAFYVATFSFTRYFGQQYALRWRMWMTDSALAKWLHDPKRGQLEGSDQRIQEDLMRFTLIFERFFIDCFNAVLLIILFTPLIFTETKNLYLFGVPLAWVLCGASLLYTVIGMFASAKIANPLIQYEYDNQKLEAEFRYNLVHVRDGANKSLGFFGIIIDGLKTNYQQIYRRQKNFNLWQKFYDQVSFLLPFLILGTNYFSGLLTFGSVMQIKSTFSRIRNSMAYLLDHYTELTEMLAISKRLIEFYDDAQVDFHVESTKPTALVSDL